MRQGSIVSSYGRESGGARPVGFWRNARNNDNQINIVSKEAISSAVAAYRRRGGSFAPSGDGGNLFLCSPNAAAKAAEMRRIGLCRGGILRRLGVSA